MRLSVFSFRDCRRGAPALALILALCVTPAAAQGTSAPAATDIPAIANPLLSPMTFADTWSIVTERGATFNLEMRQTGTSVTGSVIFWGKPLQLNGNLLGAGEKASVTLRYGNFAGTGELTLAANGQELSGTLLMADGSTIQGGTWKGTRRTAEAVALGETPDGAAPAEPAPGEGYARAVATTGVSIRDKPTSRGSEVVGSLKQGEVVSVRCPDDIRNWCALEDGRGWVYRQYINISPTAEAVPRQAAPQNAAATPKRSGGNRFLQRILGN
jgi:hypothetical protein